MTDRIFTKCDDDNYVMFFNTTQSQHIWGIAAICTGVFLAILMCFMKSSRHHLVGFVVGFSAIGAITDCIGILMGTNSRIFFIIKYSCCIGGGGVGFLLGRKSVDFICIMLTAIWGGFDIGRGVLYIIGYLVKTDEDGFTYPLYSSWECIVYVVVAVLCLTLGGCYQHSMWKKYDYWSISGLKKHHADDLIENDQADKNGQNIRIDVEAAE